MFLPRKSHLDHSGICVASVLIPHRQLASWQASLPRVAFLDAWHPPLSSDGSVCLFSQLTRNVDPWTVFLRRLRLVMPPTLFFVLQLPFTQLAYVIFPVAVANGIIAGAFTFCKNLLLLDPVFDVNFVISSRHRIWLHALCVGIPPYSPDIISNYLCYPQPSSHETPPIPERYEKIPSCASLQELRAWIWCN